MRGVAEMKFSGSCSIRRGKMSKLSIFLSNLKKIRMNYSSSGIYRGNHLVFSLFSLLSS